MNNDIRVLEENHRKNGYMNSFIDCLAHAISLMLERKELTRKVMNK